MQNPRIGIIIGSKSDWHLVEKALEATKDLHLPCVVRIASAHRTPEAVERWIKEAEASGVEVFIAVAGKAAHLAGVVAAHTIRPVIGVPVESAALSGFDALLSTVQMPKGIPVATVALGKHGGTNAALLAIQILALGDAGLRKRLLAHKAKMAAGVEESSRKLQDRV